VRRCSCTLLRKFAATKRGARTAYSPHREQLSGFVHFHRQLRERKRRSPIHTHRRTSLETHLQPIAIGADASVLTRDAKRPAGKRRMRNLSTRMAVASLQCIRITYLHRGIRAPLPATTLRYNPPRVERLRCRSCCVQQRAYTTVAVDRRQKSPAMGKVAFRCQI
jgi:hypothetical protein